ncbi:Phosphoglycolate phosphatase [Pseudovibrio axinellae]|uniref:Phosphoglycolate phosphatase n=1 Tax=Pseudovibrio axinellae TaxID=989403 RepID=A0A166B727_9HYPH|nr:HAD family phosphatase [Pseudovibrio axinellae]KZL21976.1 Phosphoglycolate phosphatase [Pseudovibrio axinellae]SEQ60056.1 2-haloacid dehalogenase [Pseudovibrio axinellae]
MSKPISGVVFDIGNVLIAWDPQNLYKDLIPDEDERNYFLSEVCPPEWNVEQDRGRPWQDAINERLAKFPQYEEWITAYYERWEEMLGGAIEDNVALLSELKDSGVSLYAITNFSSEKFEEAKRIFTFLGDSFIDTVVSGDEKLLKPDLEIYKVLLERNQLEPSALLFIDDTLENVEAAQSIGMNALHFSTKSRLRTELQQLGLPVQ